MTIGVLGGGQLGRMLALAGLTLGERFVFMDPSREACAGRVGELFVGSYDDVGALAELSRRSDVVTYEFENVPVSCARFLADRVAVYPPARALEVSQDRFLEKSFFESLGVITAPFAAFEAGDSREAFDRALEKIGLPAVVKTRRYGYDGKGQAVLRTDEDARRAWLTLGATGLIIEKFIAFEREASIICVRGKNRRNALLSARGKRASCRYFARELSGVTAARTKRRRRRCAEERSRRSRVARAGCARLRGGPRDRVLRARGPSRRK